MEFSRSIREPNTERHAFTLERAGRRSNRLPVSHRVPPHKKLIRHKSGDKKRTKKATTLLPALKNASNSPSDLLRCEEIALDLPAESSVSASQHSGHNHTLAQMRLVYASDDLPDENAGIPRSSRCTGG